MVHLFVREERDETIGLVGFVDESLMALPLGVNVHLNVRDERHHTAGIHHRTIMIRIDVSGLTSGHLRIIGLGCNRLHHLLQHIVNVGHSPGEDSSWCG